MGWASSGRRLDAATRGPNDLETAVLDAISTGAPMSAGDVARRIGRRHDSVLYQLRRLVDRGEVQLVRPHSRRGNLAALYQAVS